MVDSLAPASLAPAVDRAARILGVLEAEARPLGVSDLARRLGDNKSSVHAVLETLRRHGLVEKDDSSKQYRLGLRLVRLGQAALGGRDLAALAHPRLVALAGETGQMALLLVRAGDRALIVDRAEADRGGVRLSAEVGRRIPLAAGAAGKVFAAWASEAERPAFLAGLPRFTTRSQVDRDAYLRELVRARRDGYATDDEEYLDGARAVAAPILDARGDLLGVVLVVGLVGSFTPELVRGAAERTRVAAREISSLLGARSGEA